MRVGTKNDSSGIPYRAGRQIHHDMRSLPARVRCTCHGSCQTGPCAVARLAGRMRHGLRTKCVDACRTSRALVGDYSPRTAASLPHPAGGCNRVAGLSAALGAVDAESVAFGQRLAGAEMALDQRRVTQKGIGHDTHLATRLQMLGGALDQRFAGLVAGVHALVEGWVADDGGQLPRRSVDAIAGNDFSFEPVGGQRPATARRRRRRRPAAPARSADNGASAWHRECRHRSRNPAVGHRADYRGARAAGRCPDPADHGWHTRQADHLERPVSQLQGEMAGRASIEIWRGGRLLDLDLPELAVAGTAKLARTAEAAQLLGGALDAAALRPPGIAVGRANVPPGSATDSPSARGTSAGTAPPCRTPLRWGNAEGAAPAEALAQLLLFAGVPAPGGGARQLSQQVVGRQAGEQYPAAEQLGLTQQHFASRVHWRLPEKAGSLGALRPLSSRSCPAQLTWRSGLPAKSAVAFSAS